MAKYTGLLTSDMRGKIGGIAWSKNKSGNFARRTNVPSDPKSSRQMHGRLSMAFVAQNWRGISRADMTTWNHLATLYPRVDKLGKTFYLSGFSLFMLLNLNLIFQNRPIITTAPDISTNNVDPLAGVSVDIITTPGTEDMKLNYSGLMGIGELGILECTGVLSKGVSNPKSYKKILGFSNSFVSESSIKSAYLSTFGVFPSTGQIVWFRISTMSYSYGWPSVRQTFFSIGAI
jgi:hypothetical protein